MCLLIVLVLNCIITVPHSVAVDENFQLGSVWRFCITTTCRLSTKCVYTCNTAVFEKREVIAISQKCVNIFASNFAHLFRTKLQLSVLICALFISLMPKWCKLQQRISQLNKKLILLLRCIYAGRSFRSQSCPSVHLSVRRMRELWQNERKFCRDSYTIWKENSCSFSDT